MQPSVLFRQQEGGSDNREADTGDLRLRERRQRAEGCCAAPGAPDLGDVPLQRVEDHVRRQELSARAKVRLQQEDDAENGQTSPGSTR